MKTLIAAGVLLLVPSTWAAGRYTISKAKAAGESAHELIVLADTGAGIEAAICPAAGGELSGLRIKMGGSWVETLYRARDYTPTSDWRGKAMLLWPATGRNIPKDRDGSEFGYNWKRRYYRMPIHGFARDLPWRVERVSASKTSAEATLSLGDTPETRKLYPFGFRLTVTYDLSAGALQIHYVVRAAAENPEPMFFSIGNHITFRTPLVTGSSPGDLLFESPSSIEYLKAPPGIPTGEQRKRSFARPVRLSELPIRSAISLGGYHGQPFMRLRDPGGLRITLSHQASSLPDEPVVLFNVWSDYKTGFFSPEPWVGLQNSLNLHQGLVRLAASQAWDWTITVRPERVPRTP